MELINKLTISSEELLILIEDIKLKVDNFKLHYVVDAYDVIEFCFPKGIEGNRDDIDIEQFQNNLLGYHYIFYEVHDINKPIILDEYLYEINRNRIKFMNLHSKKDYSNDFLYDLKLEEEKFENFEDSVKYLELISDAKFLMASAIFNKDSISTFSDIMKNRVLYTKPKQFDTKEAEAVYDAFRYSPEDSKNAVSILNSWFEEKKLDFIGQTPQEIMYELEATLRDFKAIDRIIKANNKIKNSAYPRNLFLYFSNSSRTKNIFNSRAFKIWYSQNSINAFENLPILRNINDAIILFLLNIDLNKTDKEQDLTVLKNLEHLHELSTKNDQAKNESELNWIKEFKNKQLLALASDSISSKLSLNKEYQEKVEKSIIEIESKLRIEGKINLAQHFREEFESARSDISELKSFKNLGFTISIQNRLNDFLRHIHSGSYKIENKQGKDYITGTFHKLPILLFHSEIYSGIKDGILPFQVCDEVLTNLVKPEIDSEKENARFLEKIRAILKYRTIYSGKDDFENDHKLIMIFMMMLIIEDNEIDENVLSILETVPDVLDKIYLNSSVTDSKLKIDVLPFEERKSFVEYLYFKAWILRRCKKYDLSEQVCEEGIEKSPADARFHHGIALLKFCQYHDERSLTDAASREVGYIITVTEKALFLYEQAALDVTDRLLQGTIMSLQNMLSYLLVHDCLNKYIKDGSIENSYLENSLKAINELQISIKLFSSGKFDSHFELRLTQMLIKILTGLISDDPYRGIVLMHLKRDLKALLLKFDKKPYITFDYEIIEMVLKIE